MKKLITLLLIFIASVNITNATCLPGWTYESTLQISSSAGVLPLTNYWVSFVLNTQTYVSGGQMQANGNDLRFTDNSCNPLLYWIQSGMNSTTTQIWVRIPSITLTTQTILMQYGNAIAAAGQTLPSFVNSYNVNNGTPWGNNPPCYTGLEAAALLFGGSANNYLSSVNGVSNTTISRTANESIWGVSGCTVFNENSKINTFYNCGSANCAASAYVQDNCFATNYVFFLANINFRVAPEPTMLIVNPAIINVDRKDLSTGWSKNLANNQTVAFPAYISTNASLNFTIRNTGVSNLTFPALTITGPNAADFTVTTAPTSPVVQNGSTNFTVTYNPADSLVSNAVLTIASNVGNFVINLKGSGRLFYGPQFNVGLPPLPAYTYTYSTSGGIGSGTGVFFNFSNVVQSTKQKLYWGPQMLNAGFLWMRASTDGASYGSNEHFTFSPGESNLAAGVAVWRATSVINSANCGSITTYLKCVLTTKDFSNNVFPLTDPSTLGLSEELGGLAYIANSSATLRANYIIYASNNIGGPFNYPFIDYYNFGLNNTTGCLTVGQGTGNDVASGFYWKDIAPHLNSNNPLVLNEGATAIFTAGSPFGNLDVTDDEDLSYPFTPHPERIVFSFNSAPSVFNIGQVKKSGVPMTISSTFTLQDVQNGIISYTHDGSETTHDEFMFSVKDSRGVLAFDALAPPPGTSYNFNFTINPVNDPPVVRDTSFNCSYAPIAVNKTLVATDVDNTQAQLSFTIVTPPGYGFLSGYNPGTGQYTYTPTFGSPKVDFFTYKAYDGTDFSAIKTVTINQINLPPTVSNLSLSTFEDAPLSGTLTAVDPEGDSPITFQLITNGTKGSATIFANGNYSYQPNLTMMGADYFTFKAQDPGGALSVEDTVFVRIIPRLDPGDVIVAEPNLLRLYDPVTHQDTVIAKNMGLASAINLTYKPGTSIFVFDGSNGLIKVDNSTGGQSLLSARANFSAGGLVGGAAGIVIDATGGIVLADATNGIVRVDSTTGVVTPLWSGPLLNFPTGVVYLNNGDLIVTNVAGGPFGPGTAGIKRITPGGVQTVVSSGGLIALPLDLALIDQDSIVVSDAGSFLGGSDKIYKVCLSTGVQTLVTTGGNLAVPSGLDYNFGKLYAVNKQGTKRVLDIDPNSGTQAIVTGSTLTNPWGLLVVPGCVAPIFASCPSNITVNATSNCSAVVNYSPGLNGAPVPDVTYTFSGATINSGTTNGSGSTFNFGTTLVTINATNTCGAANCSFSVTVIDITAPTITCPANITVNVNTIGCLYNGSIGTATASDNCSVTVGGPNPVGPYAMGNTNVTWTATDAFGNSTSCIQTITVVDNQAPIISCPNSVTVNNDAGNCGAVVNYTVPTDNSFCQCPSSPVAIPGYTLIGIFNNHKYFKSNASVDWITANNNAIALGGHLATITSPAENAFLTPGAEGWIGLTDEAIEGTFVWANGEPVVYTNWNGGEPNNSGNEDYVQFYNTGFWNDLAASPLLPYTVEFDCAGVTLTSGLTSGSTFPIGNSNVTYQVNDANGLSSSCSFSVTVIDNQLPSITCPADITINVNNIGCTYNGSIGTATASDNCSGVTVTSSPTAPYQVGVTNVTWTATDASGNSASCIQTITVVNTLAASASGTNISCFGAHNGSASVTASGGSPFLNSNVFNYTGSLQNYTIPNGITSIRIEAKGAQGGNAASQGTMTGGLGAYMSGDFAVTPGQVLNILSGGQGGYSTSCGGGGGGGSFVVSNSTLLIAAGGGGGAMICFYNSSVGGNGMPGLTTTAGGSGGIGNCYDNGASAPSGGINGNGGGTGSPYSGGGGGYLTAGANGSNAGVGGYGGGAYPGIGGFGNSSQGGYGGGGSGYDYCCGSAGGGGGYSGGAGGNECAPAGGGGSFNIGTNQINTSGVQTGNGQVVISFATQSYTYQWSNGQTTTTATGLAAGTHCVTITDANGCSVVACYTVTEPAILASTLSGTNVACKGSNTGATNLTPSGGTQPYHYLWNNGSTSEDLNNLAKGTYTVTITDANGCTKTASIIISQPATLLTVSITKTDVRCGGKSTGTATALPTGGVTAYGYLWGDGSTNDTRGNLAAGTYTVTVTDAAGCSKTKTFTINQNAPQSVSVIMPPIMPVNQYFASNGGGVGPYSYYWNTAPAQTTQTATILTSGSNYKVKVTDSKGCTVLSSVFSVAKVGQTSSNVIGIAVMPNPTTGLVTLTVSNCINCNVLINMFDAIGQEVYSKEMKVESNTTLDFSGLATGIYTMRVMYDGRIEVVKIVIQ